MDCFGFRKLQKGSAHTLAFDRWAHRDVVDIEPVRRAAPGRSAMAAEQGTTDIQGEVIAAASSILGLTLVCHWLNERP